MAERRAERAPGGAPETLVQMSERLDAERFVGREDLLGLIDDARAGRVTTRVLYVHGPGGVGKSGLLRAIARRVEADGGRCVRIDGRTVLPTKDGLADALAAASPGPSVVLLDEVDPLVPLRLELTALLASTLSASSVAVIAGRTPPERGWPGGDLDRVAAAHLLRPLSDDEARLLIRRGGEVGAALDDAEVDALVAWSGGYPLPLTVALASGPAGPSPHAAAPGATGPSSVEAVVLERLGGRELDEVDPDVVDVAAVAPAVDGRMLAEVLPGRPTRTALAQLRSCSLTEPIGGRVMLHPLVRNAARARLRDTDPDRYRSLVVAIADHIHDRIVADGSWSPMDLCDLVEEGPVRHVFGPSATHYVDRSRPEDRERIPDRLGGLGTEWSARLWRWCEDVPDAVPIVRRADGTIVGIGVGAAIWQVPAWARDAIEVRPVLDHADERGRTDQTLFIHDMRVVEDSPAAQAEAVRVGNIGLARLSSFKNPRWVYVTVPPHEMPAVLAFGYVLVPELERRDDERELQTAVIDHGPGGFIGGMRDLVRGAQGVAPVEGDTGRGEALVDALRTYRDDAALVRSPLAASTDPCSPSAAAAFVRAQVLGALDATFDDSPVDRELARALRRAYVDPDGGHAVARQELHMSRSAFFRHLQRGRDRLARTDV